MGYAPEQQQTREISTSTTTHVRPAITPEIHRAPPNSRFDFVSDADGKNLPQRFSVLCERVETAKFQCNDYGANQAVAHVLMYCWKHYQLREEYLCKERDTTREIWELLSELLLARCAAILMAKTGLLSELVRSFLVKSDGFHTA